MAYLENSIDRYNVTLDILSEDFKNRDNLNVVDIGGYGYLTDMLKARYSVGSAIDVSCDDLNTNKINLQNESVDIILLCEVIEHLYNPDMVISECRRILRKDGILILTTPNLVSWFNRILFVMGFFPTNMDISCQLRYSGKRDILPKKPVSGIKFNPLFDVHVRLYTLRALDLLLQEWGFKITNRCGYVVSESSNYRIGYSLNILNRFFGRFPTLAQGLVLKARAV